MRPRPQLLLHGLIKLVAVVAAASLAGIGIGAGLAKLSGDSPATSPIAATTHAAAKPPAGITGASQQLASTTEPAATPTTATTTTTAGPPAAVQGTANPDVAVEVLSARIGTPSPTTGHARVSAEIRVTNKAKTPVQITTALLITGDFNVKLDSGARAGAAPLLTPIAAGASATGSLRFTTATSVTQRLLSKPTAHLRIADRTVELSLQTTQQTVTTG